MSLACLTHNYFDYSFTQAVTQAVAHINWIFVISFLVDPSLLFSGLRFIPFIDELDALSLFLTLWYIHPTILHTDTSCLQTCATAS